MAPDQTPRNENLFSMGAVFGSFEPAGPGPVSAEEFESWPQDEDNPTELIAGWVLPDNPRSAAGRLAVQLGCVLDPVAEQKKWSVLVREGHRFPGLETEVVVPDVAVHAQDGIAGPQPVARVPEIVVEFLDRKRCERKYQPSGVDFLSYQKSGVREYYYSWPDGRDASGFALQNGVFVPIAKDGDGFFASPLLGKSLRLVEAAIR